MIHPTAKCCWCQASLIRDTAGVWWCQTKACQDRQRASGIAIGQKRWFTPLPLQAEFSALRSPRKLFGGAAGGTKSFGARRLAMRRLSSIPKMQALLIRKTFPELERTHIRAFRREAPELGWDWIESRKELMVPNGSILECGHLEDEKAVQKYLSAEYDLIIVDEAVQIEPDFLMELMSRARTSNEAVKAAGGAEVWLLTNPGGPSHGLLKDLFIDKTPDTERYPAMARSYDPSQWVYLPAKLDDNPYLDPDYEHLSLTGLRRTRYEQLRHGDWDAAEGQFFEEFSVRTHARDLSLAGPLHGVVEACDWGFSSFGCVGWFVPVGDHHWHCVREWKFRKLTAEEVAEGIKERRKELGIESIAYTVVDPSMFNKTGHGQGESIAETFARFGVACRKGHNDRVMGWVRMAAWFKGNPATKTSDDDFGVPWLTFAKDCKYLLRSIPALLADKTNPEDVDSDLDDHGADMCRYFVMSRPALSVSRDPAPASVKPNTWGWHKWLHKRSEQRRSAIA
jgi:phage terminase large subunit